MIPKHVSPVYESFLSPAGGASVDCEIRRVGWLSVSMVAPKIAGARFPHGPTTTTTSTRY